MFMLIIIIIDIDGDGDREDRASSSSYMPPGGGPGGSIADGGTIGACQLSYSLAMYLFFRR
jgi:hypothetical protein